MQTGTALPNTSRQPGRSAASSVTNPGRPDTNLVIPLLTNLSDGQRRIIADRRAGAQSEAFEVVTQTRSLTAGRPRTLSCCGNRGTSGYTFG